MNYRDQESERRPTSFYMIVPCHDQYIRVWDPEPGCSHLSEYVRHMGHQTANLTQLENSLVMHFCSDGVGLVEVCTAPQSLPFP